MLEPPQNPGRFNAFEGLLIERVEIAYTVGGGGKGNQKRGELIVRNYI